VSRLRQRQDGMVLIVTLAMLVVITLFVISMIRLGNTNATIVGNMQAQKGVEAEAQQAIEMAVNKYSFFDDAIQETNTWASPTYAFAWYSAAGTTPTGLTAAAATVYANYTPTGATAAPATQSDTIQVYRPQCLFFEPTTGYSALSGIAPQDTYWDIAVVASDARTGASSEIHQGLQVRLPAGNCK
jgi:Tfp pilus assembly protein PilX